MIPARGQARLAGKIRLSPRSAHREIGEAACEAVEASFVQLIVRESGRLPAFGYYERQ